MRAGDRRVSTRASEGTCDSSTPASTKDTRRSIPRDNIIFRSPTPYSEMTFYGRCVSASASRSVSDFLSLLQEHRDYPEG